MPATNNTTVASGSIAMITGEHKTHRLRNFFKRSSKQDTRTLALALQKGINDAKSTKDLQSLLKKYYAKDIRQQEAGQPWKEGIKAVTDAENVFFGYLQNGHFNNNVVNSILVDGNKAFIEVTLTFTLKGNPAPVVANQLVEQEWKDGKLILERFWHNKQQ